MTHKGSNDTFFFTRLRIKKTVTSWTFSYESQKPEKEKGKKDTLLL